MIEFINESKKQDNTKSVMTANQAVDSTLVHLKLDPDKFEIAILACDDEKIRELNFQFRGINIKQIYCRGQRRIYHQKLVVQCQ